MKELQMTNSHKLKPMNRFMLATHVMNNTVSLFVGTFLISYIYAISDNYVINIGAFYTFHYASMFVFYYIISKLLDKTDRVGFYRIAMLIRAIFILGIIFLGDKLAQYVVVAGILNGFSEACYWTSYNVMKNELVSKHVVSRYSTSQLILCEVGNVFFALVLGKIIDASSFMVSAYIILAVVILELVCSIFIRSKRPENSSFDLKGFLARTKALGKHKKLVVYIILMAGAYSFLTVLTPLKTIIIMYSFDSNFSLGIITAVISILATILMFLINKFTKPAKRAPLFIVSSVIPVIATFALIFCVCPATIIIYSVSISLGTVIHSMSYDVSRNLLLKKLGMYDDIAEYQCAIECVMEFVRFAIFSIMVMIGALGAYFGKDGLMVSLKIYMGLSILGIPVFGALLMNYEKLLFKSGIIED